MPTHEAAASFGSGQLCGGLRIDPTGFSFLKEQEQVSEYFVNMVQVWNVQDRKCSVFILVIEMHTYTHTPYTS